MPLTSNIICEESLTGTYKQCIAIQDALLNTNKIESNKHVLISAGRKSYIKAAWYKFKNPNIFWLWLQKPTSFLRFFLPKPDLVAAPAHDQLNAKNTISTIGALNRVTEETLNKAKKDFPQFKTDKISVAVLIGGNSNTHTITPHIIKSLATQLNALDAAIFVTASRRTGEENVALLRSLLRKDIYLWDGKGENPYMGMLAHADHIIVTNDSVSMLSDAGSTGKPVHVVELNGGSKKFSRFYSALNNRGVIKPFDGMLRIWSYEPLNDTQTVVNAIKERI